MSILRLKCTKFDFRWGFARDHAEGAYSPPEGPDPLDVFKGASFNDSGKGKRKEGKMNGKGEEKGGEEKRKGKN